MLYNFAFSALFFSSAPDDFTALNNSFQISANATIQCVPISITSDSVDETGEECFTFSISTATTIAGLTLSPSEAEVCISDAEGVVLFFLYNFVVSSNVYYRVVGPTAVGTAKVTPVLWQNMCG